MHQAVESRGDSEDREDEDEEFVSSAGLDNPLGERLALLNRGGFFCRNQFLFGHGFVPGAGVSSNAFSAPCTFDSASIKKLALATDRKSTRLNSSHRTISYAV